jgi:hypothetical protein
LHDIHSLISLGFSEEEVNNMPLDLFRLHVEGAKRYQGHRRREEFVDLINAIGGAFSKDGSQKHLAALDKITE